MLAPISGIFAGIWIYQQHDITDFGPRAESQ